MPTDVHAAYARRAEEYAEHLGSMSTVHPADVHLVTTWASCVEGPLLDAGCGPGHWTAHLAGQGVDVRGVDQVPAFIDHARSTHPEVSFTLGSIDSIDDPADTYGGVVAWYSLIHHDPGAIRRPLDEFARVLRPGGRLLVGFFVGDTLESFDHAVVTAWRWPADLLTREIEAAGFDVIETHTRTAASGTPRPHGAVLARLQGADPARSQRSPGSSVTHSSSRT
jgi:SAM-dependent methyltransferase